MTGPTAAKGSFPYPHRTVAEVVAAGEWPQRWTIAAWKPPVIAAPAKVHCEQCDRMVTGWCSSRFCKVGHRSVAR